MKVPAGKRELYLLAFVTTSCKTCAGLWSEMQIAPPGLQIGAALVVVTPSKAMEDEKAAQRLVPPGALLHMGSETWFSYGVAQAGTFLLARAAPDGTPPWTAPGEVLGMASVSTLDELEPLLSQWAVKGQLGDPSSPDAGAAGTAPG